MAAGNTYEAIATLTASGGAATQLVMSSIPATYTDLVLIVNGGNSLSGATWAIQLNGDTGSNYSWTIMEGSGTTATSSRSSTSGLTIASMYFSYETGVGASGVTAIANFQNYANTTTYKTVLMRQNTVTAPNYPGVSAGVGLWRNTAAITSITIIIPGGATNIASGTTFSLYGIKAA